MLQYSFLIKILFNIYTFYSLTVDAFKAIKLFQKQELNRCLISWIIYSILIFIENDYVLSSCFSDNLITIKTIVSILIQIGKSRMQFFFIQNIFLRIERKDNRIFNFKTTIHKIFKL